MLRSACCLSLLVWIAPAPTAAAVELVDDFEAGTNHGGWTYLFSGTPATPEATGGNPGGRIHQSLCCGDLLPPSLRSNGTSPFTGDHRARGVQAVSVDLFTHAFDPASPWRGAPVSLRLVTDAGTPGDPSDDYGAFLAGGPEHAAPVDPVDGWRTISFDVPSDETALPAGWTLVGPSLIEPTVPPGASWDALVQRVSRVVFEYGPADPVPFVDVVQFFEVSADNATVERAASVPAVPLAGLGALAAALLGVGHGALRRRSGDRARHLRGSRRATRASPR